MNARAPDAPAFAPRLNLLPLRATRRRAHRQRFVLLAVLGPLLLVVLLQGGQQALSSRRLAQEQLRQQWSQQIAALQAGSRLALSDELSASDVRWLEHWLMQRGAALRILRQLAQVTPEGVMLSAFRQEEGYSLLSGQAISATALRQLEHALRQSPDWRQLTRQDAEATAPEPGQVQGFSLRLQPDQAAAHGAS